MRSSKARSAADSVLYSPVFTSFQSFFSSVVFIKTEFIFKPSGAGRRFAPLPLPELVDEGTAAERSTRR